ncbi:MAG: type I-D CRISPR-associated protein Cas7/Csc2 [Myxococcota bacterium]
MLIPSLSSHATRLAKAYENYPRGRYVHLFLMRTTRSETIFRTEGNGEPLCRETLSFDGSEQVHIVMTKRKQVAVERRTGRELLRRHALLFAPPKANDKLCSLNTGAPCERCMDCWLYGYAVGQGGAQRSRVLTEDAFSLLPAEEITDTRTFNAIYENGTMRNPETGEASQALGESEYVRPQSHFADIQVLRDVTEAELVYVIGNVLRSTRYGAISSRIGRMDNELLAIAFSDQELDSTLSWLTAAQAVLGAGVRHPLDDTRARGVLVQALDSVGAHALGRVDWVRGAELETLIGEVRAAYETDLAWLATATEQYPEPPNKKNSGKKRSS